MAAQIKISPIDPSAKQLETLAAEARCQGYSFVDRLIEEAKSGENTFDKFGECFCGVWASGALVGCGGVNRDPYVNQEVGRLRHVFISSRVRRMGLARALVQSLLNRSKASFDTIRLRTSDQNADRFYEALGFSCTDEESATHIIKI